MKIYLDKLPKSCWDCPCFRENVFHPCGLDFEDKGYFLDEIDGGACPLCKIEEIQNEKAIECLEKIHVILSTAIIEIDAMLKSKS